MRRAVAVALLGLALAAGDGVVAAEEKARTFSEEEMYDYSCGHLGTSCESEPARPKPRRSKRHAKSRCGRTHTRKARKHERG